MVWGRVEWVQVMLSVWQNVPRMINKITNRKELSENQCTLGKFDQLELLSLETRAKVTKSMCLDAV